MNSEYQRISSQLLTLQSQIFYSQLPPLLIPYLTNPSPSESLPTLITSLLQIQQQQFISAIAKNIVNVKQECQKLRAENQELRGLVGRQEGEIGEVRGIVGGLVGEREELKQKLQQLRSSQQSLSKLLNTTQLESKLTQLLTDSTHQKSLLSQTQSLLQQKTLQIKHHIQKQLYYTSQITALENDNTLFHRDLTSANFRVERLEKEKEELLREVEEGRRRYGELEGKVGVEVGGREEELGRLRKVVEEFQGVVREERRKNQDMGREMERELKMCNDVKQQVNFLRECMQKLQQQLHQTKQTLSKTSTTLTQSTLQSTTLQSTLTTLQQSHHSQISLLQSQLNTTCTQNTQLQQTICILQKNIEELSQRCLGVEREREEERVRMGDVVGELEGKLGDMGRRKEEVEGELGVLRGVQGELRGELGVLRERIERLEDQIRLQRQNTEYYKIYLQQNNQLRNELDRISQNLRQHPQTHTSSSSKKHLFQLLQVSEQMQKLRRDQVTLRGLVVSLIQGTRKWTTKEVNKIVCGVIEKRSQFQISVHWQQYEKNKMATQQCKSPKGPTDLRFLTQKYKQIKQQNQKEQTRIQQILQQ